LTWDRSTVANLEHGRRGAVSIEEVLGLAYVFGVPPILMFLPLGIEDRVSITPSLSIHPHFAVKWVRGDEASMVPAPDGEGFLAKDLAAWKRAASAIWSYDALEQAQARCNRTRAAMVSAEFIGNAARLERARAEHRDALSGFVDALGVLVDDGLHPPAFGREWVDEVKAAGLEWPTGAPIMRKRRS